MDIALIGAKKDRERLGIGTVKISSHLRHVFSHPVNMLAEGMVAPLDAECWLEIVRVRLGKCF